jgi:hypothetical protein
VEGVLVEVVLLRLLVMDRMVDMWRCRLGIRIQMESTMDNALACDRISSRGRQHRVGMLLESRVTSGVGIHRHHSIAGHASLLVNFPPPFFPLLRAASLSV